MCICTLQRHIEYNVIKQTLKKKSSLIKEWVKVREKVEEIAFLHETLMKDISEKRTAS